jgi:hypothetical protein
VRVVDHQFLVQVPTYECILRACFLTLNKMPRQTRHRTPLEAAASTAAQATSSSSATISSSQQRAQITLPRPKEDVLASILVLLRDRGVPYDSVHNAVYFKDLVERCGDIVLSENQFKHIVTEINDTTTLLFGRRDIPEIKKQGKRRIRVEAVYEILRRAGHESALAAPTRAAPQPRAQPTVPPSLALVREPVIKAAPALVAAEASMVVMKTFVDEHGCATSELLARLEGINSMLIYIYHVLYQNCFNLEGLPVCQGLFATYGRATARAIVNELTLSLLDKVKVPAPDQLRADMQEPLALFETQADVNSLEEDLRQMLITPAGLDHDLVLIMFRATFPVIQTVHFHLALQQYVQNVGYSINANDLDAVLMIV